MTDEQCAEKIAEVSPLDYEEALAALKAGNGSRETALEILDSIADYQRDLDGIAKARTRLRELSPP